MRPSHFCLSDRPAVLRLELPPPLPEAVATNHSRRSSFMPMPKDAHESPRRGPCVIEAAINAHLTLPGGERMSRDDFHAWLWERTDGLLGIDEGTVTTADASPPTPPMSRRRSRFMCSTTSTGSTAGIRAPSAPG